MKDSEALHVNEEIAPWITPRPAYMREVEPLLASRELSEKPDFRRRITNPELTLICRELAPKKAQNGIRRLGLSAIR